MNEPFVEDGFRREYTGRVTVRFLDRKLGEEAVRAFAEAHGLGEATRKEAGNWTFPVSPDRDYATVGRELAADPLTEHAWPEMRSEYRRG